MTRRSKCWRFLATFASGTRWNHRLGPPHPAGSTHARSGVLSSSTFVAEGGRPERRDRERVVAVEGHGLHEGGHALTLVRVRPHRWRRGGGSLG